MENILEKYNVSRETLDDLKAFQAMVLEWNTKFNLIGKNSVPDIWNRHIIDSAQLCQFIKEDNLLYDFGSGAGFPGIVLAIIAKQNFPNLKICLIESITKKTLFLNEVKSKLNLDIDIYNDRVENLKPCKVDIITSRAMSSLDKLLAYAIPFTKKETKIIFPKGEKWKEELDSAEKIYSFDYQVISSITNDKARILYIKNIRRK